MSLTTTLNKRGYSVIKEELSSKEIYDLRKDLTVKPFISADYGPEPKLFPDNSQDQIQCKII